MKNYLKFDRRYFCSGGYKGVDFDKKFSMYWWSCRFYANLIGKFCPKGKILDIGCGLGHLLSRLGKDFGTYGIDINPWAIKKAKLVSPQSHFFCLPAEKIDQLKGKKFEVVVMRHLVEHLKNPTSVFDKVAHLLKKDGFIILATPNPESLSAKFMKDKWIGYKDSTHISLKPPEFWLKLLEENGFSIKVKTTDGFWAAPYVQIIPTLVQKTLFGFLGGIQAISGIIFLPVNWGESLIVVAQKGKVGI